MATGNIFDDGMCVREEWLTRDEQLGYYKWSRKQADEMDKAFLYTPTSRKDLKEIISGMNTTARRTAESL